jgi:zinc/manganese transport system substrate-binding protein
MRIRLILVFVVWCRLRTMDRLLVLLRRPSRTPRITRPALPLAITLGLDITLGLAITLSLAGCGAATITPTAANGRIVAVGAENEYANVISQIGGRYVAVTAIESNPNTDPHTFEASPSVASVVSSARLVVQNGLGYDAYMNKIESASPSSSRKVIDVQTLLRLPDSTSNPHLWYKPQTMPAVAHALVADLSALRPADAAYFAANEKRFDASLTPWAQALKSFATRYPNTPVATTEPVGDYMLQAAGTVNMTPFTLQADIMNGVDPAPQDVTLQNNLFGQHRVKVFVYNQQVTDSLTQSFLSSAQSHGIPVVGVYETMPTGFSYQKWMLAEVSALRRAVADGVSTRRL